MQSITRNALHNTVQFHLNTFRAVELVGPRQVGKTTLARQFLASTSTHYFDLENPLSRQQLGQSPFEVLSKLDGLVVIDEVQHMPELFELLRVLIDRPDRINRMGQYLLLGSASPAAMHQKESLLGRAASIEVTGFNLDELAVSAAAMHRLWLRGGMPLSYLANDDKNAQSWIHQAMNRYLYNDLPLLGMNVPAPMMLRFWRMLAHYHGQTWNASALAQSLGISENTVRRYLDYLTRTFMVRQLPPWYENLGKRQVKAPKIYFRDTGFLHALLALETLPQLLHHPICGASWEGFALEQVLRLAKPEEAYFWATHQGAELDLLLMRGSQRIGVEFKRSDAPKITQSMRIARDDLKLDALYVVYPGDQRYLMGEGFEAVPLWAALPA